MKKTVVVDDFGRLVLPKSVRTALGIFGRAALTLELVGEKAELAAATSRRSEVKRKGGRTIYSGPIPEDWDSGAAVLEMRQRRLHRP
jgi:bifunctional DNA-binding transcriptional regulator/antitoxin component of YhaV-PrlF toxin-antitoxin module